MEVFSLLKYWRGGGGGGGSSGAAVATGCSNSSKTSFVTASGKDDDDGPFFDLEFTDDEAQKVERENETIHEEEEEEEEGGNDVVRGAEREGELKFRTAAKLRVLMLRLKRSKSESTATIKSQTQNQHHHQQNDNNKLFTVMKFKAEVPIISLLSRHSSDSKESYDEKRSMSRSEAVQKYLKMMKPPHVHRHQTEETAATAVVRSMKRMNLKKNLGKSKSAVVHSIPNMASSKRRDDSLLQEEDGIQSAILHCKRSFNASRGKGKMELAA